MTTQLQYRAPESVVDESRSQREPCSRTAMTSRMPVRALTRHHHRADEMKRMLRSALPLLVVGSIVACNGLGPIGPIPGGSLDGRVTPPPADWSGVRDYRTVQLETRSNSPYSVNVWGVGVGRVFYVACLPGTNWIPYVEMDPAVRLRIGDSVYELRAIRSRDPDEFALYLREMKALYDWEPSAEDAERALLWRLEPREGPVRQPDTSTREPSPGRLARLDAPTPGEQGDDEPDEPCDQPGQHVGRRLLAVERAVEVAVDR